MSKTEFIIEPGRQDLSMIRTFDAPREIVFKAISDPELVPGWFGPRRHRIEVDVLEIRTGGRWRLIAHDDTSDGAYAFNGVYHSVIAPSSLVRTFEFEGFPGQVQLESMELEETPDGKTKMIASSVFQSVQARDGMVASGMEDGASEGFDRLEEIIEELVSGA